ncbi:MAG TPA: HEPN domain-containing protein [Thermoanaerobaculia bacterium]|nr:HEPN domain-containing protein [Thermoanaerobaculia bacterium]
MRVPRLYLERAQKALRISEHLLEIGEPDSAASKLYYACFYGAQALLETRNLRFSRHGQVIAQFGLHFAKPGLIDARFHRLLDTAFELRQIADYQIEVVIDSDHVRELLQEGRQFLEAASKYLEQLSMIKEDSET